MLVGTTILKMGATPFYGPEFRRGGLAALFSAEASHEVGAASMVIDVEHRNVEDTTWALAGSFATITATGVYSVDVTGIKEIVRYKYTLSGSDLTGFHVITPPPGWRPY